MASSELRARAPTRISLAGGGSDLPTFFLNNGGGACLNMGISLYSYTSFKRIPTRFTRIISYDWNFEKNITDLNIEGDLNTIDNVDAVKAVMKSASLNPKNGYEIIISSTAKKNSGLAGSSALIVSLMASMKNYSGHSMIDRDNITLEAYDIERVKLGRVGGYQDQACSVYGGVNFMEFNKNKINIYPLRLSSDILCELHSSLLLFELPVQREVQASKIEEKKIENMDDNIEYLKQIRTLAYSSKQALLKGDTETLGRLMDSSWIVKRRMDGVSTKEIDHLYNLGKEAGAYGGKLCGAGGGGSMTFLCPLEKRKNIINAMEAAGCRQTHFDFDSMGMHSWRIGE